MPSIRPHQTDLIASTQALNLHRSLIVFDCLGLLYLLEPEYTERAIEGGVTVTNVTVATEGESFDDVLRQIDVAHDMIAKSSSLMLVTESAHIHEARRAGKLGIILGTQGSDAIGRQLNRVSLLKRLGVRYIGLAYTGATLLADGCGETRDAGLTFLGREFIEVVNSQRLILDLSHTGHQSRLEAARLAAYPVCTHSNAYTLCDNDRNTKDEVAQIVAKKGGVMGVCGMVRSLTRGRATIEHLLDHADYWVQTIGVTHAGIGLDFTEGHQESFKAGKASIRAPRWRMYRPDIFGTPEEFFTTEYAQGLTSIRLLPNLTQGLMDRGYDHEQIAEILGGAWLRNFELAVG
jgi:membrane dipeptidase